MQLVLDDDDVQATVVVMPAKKPNAITRQAMKGLEEGDYGEFTSFQALFEDLGI